VVAIVRSLEILNSSRITSREVVIKQTNHQEEIQKAAP